MRNEPGFFYQKGDGYIVFYWMCWIGLVTSFVGTLGYGFDKPGCRKETVMKLLIIALALAIAGCGQRIEEMGGEKTLTKSERGSRIQVSRIDVFMDDLAYGKARGVYLIKDTDSGAEYIGISGIGISELGSHMVGKVVISDER